VVDPGRHLASLSHWSKHSTDKKKGTKTKQMNDPTIQMHGDELEKHQNLHAHTRIQADLPLTTANDSYWWNYWPSKNLAMSDKNGYLGQKKQYLDYKYQ